MDWSCCCSCSAKMVTFFSAPFRFLLRFQISCHLSGPLYAIHSIHPARVGVGFSCFVAVWVYSACVRATVSFGSVRSRLLGFPISHLWTTCGVFLSWKLTRNDHNFDAHPQMAKLIPFFCMFKNYNIVFRLRFALEVEIFLLLAK